jgi:uncharacterized protein YdaL
MKTLFFLIFIIPPFLIKAQTINESDKIIASEQLYPNANSRLFSEGSNSSDQKKYIDLSETKVKPYFNNLISKIKGNRDNAIVLKKVLIIIDKSNDTLRAIAGAYKLENLLGHFKTSVKILQIEKYRPNLLNNYDAIFYICLQPGSQLSPSFIHDVFHSRKTIVWINDGITEFEKTINMKKKYGFSVDKPDQSNSYIRVKSNGKLFTRSGGDLFVVKIYNNNKVEEIATAESNIPGKELPYIIKSKNFYYIADVPFFNTSVTDRYLLFADLLHDILGEEHSENHYALVRIEDVTPIRDPTKLREIADILYERDIPFLIGVVPFYINPNKNIHISLSDKPQLVEALKYCVKKGGTIVLHGVTHQYKGVSAIDFEFWDGTTNKPIANETQADIENKIDTGINECVKNGIYPLIWETPHYTASIETYKIISEHFSSSIERLLLTNDYNYGQFFPYIINKDIYGQKIYPEDLGYLPLITKKDSCEQYIHRIIDNAKFLYNVRDGYASFFFHTFLDLNYLKEIADGISNLGFKFVDLRKESNWVKTKDLVILSGSQTYDLNINHLLLTEIYYNKTGDIEKIIISEKPLSGDIFKKVILKPDEFYVAELKPVIKAISSITKNTKSKSKSEKLN